VFKVPGGKLIKVKLELEDGIINLIQVQGDFFMHPEEAIEELETVLAGSSSNELHKVKDFFSSRDVQLVGVVPEDIVTAITMALENAKQQ